jgi:hypothetical protein
LARVTQFVTLQAGAMTERLAAEFARKLKVITNKASIDF